MIHSMASDPVDPVKGGADDYTQRRKRSRRFPGPSRLPGGEPIPQHPEAEQEHGRREDQGVHAVEHAAVPGQEVAGVLHSRAALDHRLHQVADLRRRPRSGAGGDQQAGIRRRSAQLQTTAATRPTTKLATAPSQLFFGLITGASLWRPIREPT